MTLIECMANAPSLWSLSMAPQKKGGGTPYDLTTKSLVNWSELLEAWTPTAGSSDQLIGAP